MYLAGDEFKYLITIFFQFDGNQALPGLVDKSCSIKETRGIDNYICFLYT